MIDFFRKTKLVATLWAALTFACVGNSIAQQPTNTANRPATRNSIGMVLQYIEPGYYERRCGYNRPDYFDAFSSNANYSGFSDENPAHDVVITRPFLIASTEVTVGQFRQFAEATRYQTTAEKSGKGIIGLHGETNPERRIFNPLGQRPKFTWKSPGFEQTDKHPVTGVSWDDAQAFCRWLSEKENATYRLPTEAEWEYACRAGTKTWFSFGDDYTTQFPKHANIADATLEAAHERVASTQWILPAGRDGAAYTAEVGSYQANAWGLHDMHGNVWEWCHDVYNDVYYKRFRASGENAYNAAIDPLNRGEHTWEDGEFRSIRGGAWIVAPIQSRTGTRGQFERTDAACYLGFRVVRDAPADKLAEADAYRRRQAAAEQTIKNFDRAELKFENAPDGAPSDLVLYNHGDPPPSDFVEAVQFMTRLRMFRPHGKVTPELIQSTAKLTRLRRLVFSYPQEDCPAEEYRGLANLEHLVDFRARGSSIMPAVLRQFKCLPKLWMLEFGNESIDDEQILQLQGINFEKLTWLNLQGTASDGSGLAAFAGAPLKTVFLRTLTDAGAAQLSKFPQLTSVTINEPKISRAGLIELSKLQHLERLNLQNLKQLADEDFASLQTMTGLRSLRLIGSGAGDQTARVISRLLLSELQIGSPSLTDEGLKHIGGITTLCNDLEIGHEAKITDRGLDYLWGPARLRSLKIHCRTGITGRGCETISDLTELRTIEIASEDFTDRGMRFLGYLPNLQNVTLGHNRHGPKGVTDEGMLMLAEAPALKRLTIFRTGSQITDEGIEKLKQKLPKLELSVRD